MDLENRHMRKVLLINQENLPHYRIGVYNYLSSYLERENFALTIVSDGVEEGNSHQIEFDHKETSLSFWYLARLIIEMNPEVVIYWVNLRHLYLFPILFLIKLWNKKAIYWGHGIDLARKRPVRLKEIANNIEHWISDAIILYREDLKRNVKKQFHFKTFTANNTLYLNTSHRGFQDKNSCLKKYNITTTKNIICVGRMQKRKKLENLFKAFMLLGQRDVGLILIGPDCDGILREVHGDNIYKLGPIYGDETLDLLYAADVFCLPGAVGLSIVDAFHCELPIVTEEGDESPEMMYLKDGINGFIVPKDDVEQMAAKLNLLLENDAKREQFSTEALKEIRINGHVDKMCEGFRDALQFVCHEKSVS